ncbi:MAG: Fic family protein [Deltaproteobacteria bacterium]|nr:Fic family protein [Deltaproteobacteria bacterium]
MREWSIETGQVENLYLIDDDLAKAMIDQGLSSVELPRRTHGIESIDAAAVIGNHYQIIKSLYGRFESYYPLTAFAVRGLHAAFVENQDFAVGLSPSGRHVPICLLKGAFKKWPNNPLTPDGLLHQYCPPEQVDSEMQRLLEMHHAHLEGNVQPDIEAAWLHHRFIQIHPFQDGNGRVARALASLEYIKGGFFPPVVTAAGKPEYIHALDLANKGDLQPFVRYLSGLVIKTTRQFMDLAEIPAKGD